MKLKQALVLGLTTAVLAIPALAADEATDTSSLPSVNAEQNAAVITPAKKDAFHKKGSKDSNASLATKKADDLSKLSTVNPNEPAKN